MTAGRMFLVAAAVLACVIGASALASAAGCSVGCQRWHPTPADDPGGSDDARVPVPPPASSKSFGVSFDVQAYAERGQFEPQLVAARAFEMGSNVVRMPLRWAALEPTQRGYRDFLWRAFDVAVAELRKRGIRPLFELGSAPPWARDSGRSCGNRAGCEYPPGRSKLPAFERHLREVAQRWPGAVYATASEPNNDTFWKPEPDPAHYAAVHKAAYRAIKSVDRNATVLAGSFSRARVTETVGGRRSTIGVRQFVRNLYKRGIGGHVDGLAIHVMTQNTKRFGEKSTLANAIEDLRVATEASGDAGREIWLTEFGHSTSGGGAVSPIEQARGLLRQYRRAMTIRDVEGAIINNLVDDTAAPQTTAGRGYGIRRGLGQGRAKPAWCQFAGRALERRRPNSECPRIDDAMLADALAVSHPREITRGVRRCRRWANSVARLRSKPRWKKLRVIDKCSRGYVVRFLTDPASVRTPVKRRCRNKVHSQGRKTQARRRRCRKLFAVRLLAKAGPNIRWSQRARIGYDVG